MSMDLARAMYAILDPAHCRGRDPVSIGQALIDSNPVALQLRTKTGDDVDRLRLARALRLRCQRAAIPFIVNDRVDLAALAEADGVHLGQNDISLADARTILGKVPSIGLSTHCLQQARDAARDGATLIGFGPVFSTSTKTNPDPAVGLDGLHEVVESVSIPVVAIGGIQKNHLAAIRGTGASMFAAISAITEADDPAAAAREMVDAWEASRS